jgi:hypothetical protein
MLFYVNKNIPKIRTKKYYKYYKKRNDDFDVFYNKDMVVLDSKSITVFAYENTIVFSSRDYLTNKVVRDFAVTGRSKPHQINKEPATYQLVSSVVSSLKRLIKKYIKGSTENDFTYTYKPFTVCFVKLDYEEKSIVHYEFSHETMKWVQIDSKKLNPCCEDFDWMTDYEIVMDRYLTIRGYKYDDTDAGYYVQDYEYEEYEEEYYEDEDTLPKYGVALIYDLLTGNLVHGANTRTIKDEEDENEHEPFNITLKNRTIMFIGTESHIITMAQYSKNIVWAIITNVTLKSKEQVITYQIDVDTDANDPILYIFRNLQDSQLFIIYNNKVELYNKEPNGYRLVGQGSIIRKFSEKESKIEHMFLYERNFFALLSIDRDEGHLKALCIYYNHKEDKYEYGLLDLSELFSNTEDARKVELVGRIFYADNTEDCIGIIISIGIIRFEMILYDKLKGQFFVEHIGNYDKTITMLDNKEIWDFVRKILNKKIPDKIRIGVSVQLNNKYRLHNYYESPILNGSYVVFNTKQEKKISIFYAQPFGINNKTDIHIVPDTYHNLGLLVEKCFFECEVPVLVHTY